MNFRSFPSINGFHNVVKLVETYPHVTGNAPVEYRGKIKLHGTNASVQIRSGKIVPQSRTQIIPENDKGNRAFYKFVMENEAYFKSLPDGVVFGEWCGRGVVSGNTAINALDQKHFVVFAIIVGEATDEFGTGETFIVSPEKIAQFIGENKPNNMIVLPWHDGPITVDFTQRSTLESLVAHCNKIVQQIEVFDPWVKKTFDIEGKGEGVVYYPSTNEDITYKRFHDLAFKAKGEEHKVVKTKEAVQIDPEVAASIDEFVELFVTEARLQQGVASVGLDSKKVGDFLKWFNTDVIKESVDELAVANLTWDQVQKNVQNAARIWYVAKCKETV